MEHPGSLVHTKAAKVHQLSRTAVAVAAMRWIQSSARVKAGRQNQLLFFLSLVVFPHQSVLSVNTP